MSCTCVKTPTGSGKGKVSGFTTDGSCEFCVAQRALDAVSSAEQQEQSDISIMIAEKANKMAEDELIKEGKLEKIDDKLKIKQ